MSHRRLLFVVVLVALIASLGSPANTAEQTLIAPGAIWKYNDSGTNLGTSWRAIAFNDGSWSTGVAQLGYGDGDEATPLSWGSNANNRRITYYFRRSFTVTNPSAIEALTVRFVRDDGLLIYLNGVEVVRSNMPTGTVTYTTRATTAIGGAAESAWNEAPIDPALLVAGNNVVAVELHQQSPTSTDISFDLELRATDATTPAPVVTLTAPADHGVINTAAVAFNASVTAPAGLADATLFVGGPPRSVVFSGPSVIEDAQISADSPAIADGGGLAINVDGQTPHAHGLMKFPTLIGTGTGQVPPGSIITSATLQLNCTNAGNMMKLYRLTQSWVEDQATWNERSAGVPWGAPGAEGAGSNAGVSIDGDCTAAGQRLVALTSFVQDWSNGLPNHGLVLIESGTDGIDFDSSESTNSPVLTVAFKSEQVPVATQSLSGTAADLVFSSTLPLGQTYFWNVRVTDDDGQQSWAPSDFELIVDANSPDAPVIVSPADGATGVVTSPSLSALVSDPAGEPLNVSVDLRRAAGPEFTIVALPDTQHYSESFPDIFTAQTQWIVDNKDARNIVFVTHEGDIVNTNVTPQWDRALVSMQLLDGVVPYGMGPGNHDQPTTLYNQYFPYEKYQGLPWYGGHRGDLNDNNFQLISASGLDFVIVHLEFCPPAGAVTWADSVLKTYPDRIGIMTTHGYLNESAQRSVHGCTNTQYLWDGLAVPNPNLHFMLSGHVHDESRRVDVVNGHPVYQMLADYQGRVNGGDGWLRILRFVPAEDKVFVQTYSPWQNVFETDANSEFTLDFPMGGAWGNVGTASASSGSPASVTAMSLEPNTRYEWRMTVTNASGKSRTGPVWSFTTGTGGPVNQPPSADGQAVDVVEDTPRLITLNGSDPEGAPLTYSVVTPPAHGTLTGSAPDVVYQPAANYSGPDSFTFRVSDGQTTSTPATAAIIVQPVNDAPSAVVDSYATPGGTLLTIAAPGVLANDADVENAPLTAQLVSPPSHGALALNPNGSFSYTPVAGYAGPDAFVYAASDGAMLSGGTTVTLTVLPGDTTPPVRTNGQPAGTLPAGTTQATLTLTTSEAAICRYATSAGSLYGSMSNAFATTGGTSHSTPVSGLSGGGSYGFFVKCADSLGNANTDDLVIAFSVATPPPTGGGLVAAYSFDEGSGTTLTDRASASHTGTISGATWTPQGRFGSALSFDGVNDSVAVADTAALDLTTGMTLEAWVYPTASSNWRTVMMKEASGELAYALYASESASRPGVWVRIGSTSWSLGGGGSLPTNSWTHLATTYDGATLRLFVNGTQVSSVARSGSIVATTSPLRLGGNSVWGEYFAGRIDEVRVYNRALTAAEIQTDMGTPVVPLGPPRLVITAPSSGASVTGSTVNVTYTSAGPLTSEIDHVHFRLDGGADLMEPPPLDGTFTLTAVGPGLHALDGYYVRADHTKVAGTDAVPVSFTVTAPDTTAPGVGLSSPVQGATVSGSVTIAASASDNIGVSGVQFKVDGVNVGPEDTVAPYNTPWATGTVANGVHTLTAVARDGAGNVTTSDPVLVTVANASSLVAAYSFDAGAGTTLSDMSGRGQTGTISGATWTPGGHSGSALSFDGVNDLVTIADTAALDLTTAMTLEAWVYPTASSNWRTVIIKEAAGELAYALYASEDAQRPGAWVRVGSTSWPVSGTAGLPLNSWSHLAVTYDGAALRLFVNGVQVSAVGRTGSIVATTNPLRLGGNGVWGEYFAGRIDDVRIYNRALSPTEIQGDMATPVGP